MNYLPPKTLKNNAFLQASEVESKAMVKLLPFIESNVKRYVITNKGNLSKKLQKEAGDCLVNSYDDKIWGIEIKAEVENKHDNFFLETWSNLKRYTLGWMYNLKTDRLFYYFLESSELYVINFHWLKEWCFKDGYIYNFPEKPQKKYNQMNDTWGRCVPIKVIDNTIGFKYFNIP